ncbi:hypothetical protein, partial [Rhodomicrobium udaipurense]
MPPFFAIRAGVSARVSVLAAAAACLGAAVALSGCAGLSIRNAPINSALTDSAEAAETGDFVQSASPAGSGDASDTV